jgi:hypothetical protein
MVPVARAVPDGCRAGILPAHLTANDGNRLSFSGQGFKAGFQGLGFRARKSAAAGLRVRLPTAHEPAALHATSSSRSE